MTEHEIIEFSRLFARQFGGSHEVALETLGDWSYKLRNVAYDQACTELMKLASSDDIPSRPAQRISKIVVACLGTPVFSKKSNTVNYPDCHLCGKSGFVVVPHPKDYTVGEFWKGEYTCAAACMCDAGERFRGYHRTLESYEREFPNWKQEYPLRQFERRALLKLPNAEYELNEFYAQQDRENAYVDQEPEASRSQHQLDFEAEGIGQEDREGDSATAGSEGRTGAGEGIGAEGNALEGVGELTGRA